MNGDHEKAWGMGSIGPADITRFARGHPARWYPLLGCPDGSRRGMGARWRGDGRAVGASRSTKPSGPSWQSYPPNSRRHKLLRTDGSPVPAPPPGRPALSVGLPCLPWSRSASARMGTTRRRAAYVTTRSERQARRRMDDSSIAARSDDMQGLGPTPTCLSHARLRRQVLEAWPATDHAPVPADLRIRHHEPPPDGP